MATNTYVALASYTIPSAVSTYTFTSIPQTYTDLVMVVNGGLSTANQSFRFQVGNGTIDTGNNYSYTYLAGNGSSASSSRASNTSGFNAYHVAGQSDANIKNNVILHFQNYSNTTTYKTVLNRGNSDLETAATVALWRSTAAINTILVGTTSGNIVAGTTITIYGVAAASVGAKATGGTIYQDASYFYHVFSGNGTFTPTQSISADVLVVAGGGSGGGYAGGGGGAGGLLGFTSQSLASGTGYTCTVGAGAAGGVSSPGNGSSSQFASLTAPAGGGYGAIGGGVTSWGANTGGSGGGGGSSNPTASGAAGTSGQGYAGGNGGGAGGNYVGGGGGGSGAVGETAATQTPATAPSGGNGTSAYSSWVIATGIGDVVSGTGYVAGGGGGNKSNNAAPTVTARSFGGYGGGGRGAEMDGSGSTLVSAENGRINTGSGGGGGGNSSNTNICAAGGSGVVIVRYAK